MNEQVENAVNPGQAIYDALSDEAKSAVDALPDELFAGTAAIDTANQIADLIEIAQSSDPNGWALLSSDRGEPALILSIFGEATFGRMKGREYFEVMVDDSVSESIRASAKPRNRSTDEPGQMGVMLIVPDESKLDLPHLDELRSLARMQVEQKSKTGWRRTIDANFHRDDWRVKLALIAGRMVSAPGYISERHLGLSQSSIDAPTWLRDRITIDALPLLQHAIGVANEVHPQSWSLSGGKSRSTFVRFDVQGTSVLEFHAKRMRVVVPEPWFEQNGPTIKADMLHPMKSPAGSVRVQLSPEHGLHGFMELSEPVGDIVQQLASMTRTKTQRAREHRPELVDDISDFLKEDVSQPGYVTEDDWETREDDTPKLQEVSDIGTTRHSLNVSIASLGSKFESSGLTYTTSQVASFYTALQTKGFVILSGISGTGKSKIAQRFAELLPAAATAVQRQLREESTLIRLKLWPYMAKYNRFTVPKSHAAMLPKPEPGSSIPVAVVINEVAGEGRFGVSTPGDGILTEVHLKGEAAKRFDDFGVDYFYVDFELQDDDTVGTVKVWSEIPAVEMEKGGETTSNHLFLPVRPDWRDGKALIGYHNPLTGDYVRTDFLDLVITAADDYRADNRNAYFVILDEMNLAHVEYYFADVLSVIESGRDEEGWTVEGIPLNVGEEDADLPDVLKLPPNLYIVGTVNMDETTHPFSPKVLDRAFTIELTEVDFTGYPPEPPEGFELDEDEKQALLAAFTQGGRYPRIDKDDIRTVVAEHGRYRDDLESLNRSLRRSRLHFGYRVFDEIMQFVFNAKHNELFTPDEAFDHAVLMKVLPKFNGSRGKLQNAMFDLIHWCRTDGTLTPEQRMALEAQFSTFSTDGTPFDSVVIQGSESADDWRYPATGKRAALMMQDLYTDGFASFG